MKLVELLARELKEWPEGVDGIWQDYDKELRFHGDLATSLTGIFLSAKCGDCIRAHGEKTPSIRVTRADWEAERARIAKPSEAKWVRHRGGKCPVEAGVLVDVRFRDGEIAPRCRAGSRVSDHKERCASAWTHYNSPFDITAYRICEPVQTAEPEPLTADEWAAVTQPDTFTISIRDQHPGNPLMWRDRIHAIDATVEALEEERASLVQRLTDEGLQLVGVVARPAEDMSDWRNWRAGDIVECIKDTQSRGIKIGGLYSLTYATSCGIGFLDEDQDHRDRGDIETFKFHSRPSD